MTLCIWVKHPDIEKCILSIASPEILCNNIETGAVLSDGCPVPEMFVPQWLQGWLVGTTACTSLPRVCDNRGFFTSLKG